MMKIQFLAAALFTTPALASVSLFTATIDGDQETTPSGSPATGTLTGEYDSVANTFSFSWTITDNLIGMPASPGAHLHNAPAGSNGGIVFGFNEPDGTWALSGSAVWENIDAGLVSELFAGNIYANYHTSSFPGGEVRGQITLVPAPATAATLGLLGLAAARRRR